MLELLKKIFFGEKKETPVVIEKSIHEQLTETLAETKRLKDEQKAKEESK